MKSVYWVSLLAVALSACQGANESESKLERSGDSQLLLESSIPSKCIAEERNGGDVEIYGPVLDIYIKKGELYTHKMKITAGYEETGYWYCAPEGLYEAVAIDFELVCNGKTVMAAQDYFGYAFAGGVTRMHDSTFSTLTYSTGVYWDYIKELFAPDTLCDIYAVPYLTINQSNPTKRLEVVAKGEGKKAVVNFIYE